MPCLKILLLCFAILSILSLLEGRKVKSEYKNVPKSQKSLYNELHKFGTASLGGKAVKLEEASEFIMFNANKSMYVFEAVFSRQCKKEEMKTQVITSF